MRQRIRMALFLGKAAWTAAIGGLTWETAAALARASPLRLGSYEFSVGGVVGSIRSLTSAVRFPRGAGRQERATRAVGMPTSSTSGISMRQRRCCPSPQPAAEMTSKEGATLLGNISADTAVACLELLTVQCRANDKRLTAESVEGGIVTTMLAGLAAKSAEARANRSDPLSAKALAQGSAAPRATSRDGGNRGRAQGKTAGAAAQEQDWVNKRSMKREEKIRAALVLVKLSVQKKDDLGGRSVLKLLSAMLTLRIFALEILTELAETIRRRLVCILPPDGLVAIVGAYCFFFTTPQQGEKASSVSNCVRRLDRLPAPVQDLLIDALAEIWVRVGLKRYRGGARDATDAVPPHFTVNSTSPINRKSEELSTSCVLQPIAADEGTAVSAGGKHVEQLAVSQPGVNPAKNSTVQARGFDFAAAHEGNNLSRAGAVSCAWALTRLTFSRKCILLEDLKEYLNRELSPVAKTCLNGTQGSLVHGVIAWKEEVSRLQEWGATAAAFVHLPGDQSPRVAVTIRKEVVKALRNLRVALLQKRNTPVPNPHQNALHSASLVHKHMQSFSSHARTLIMEGSHFDGILRGRLPQATRSDFSRCLIRTEPSECLASAGHRKENLTTIRDEDAATICGAVTWMLRLSAITQQDNTPILEALQMLHSEDPFMFFLSKADLCYFLAAAHEGAVADLHRINEQTLGASPERTKTSQSLRGYPSHSSPETKGNNKLPAFLHWTLLLLPLVTTAAEGLFEVMPPRVLALLLTMLSLLPDTIATCEGQKKTPKCSPTGGVHAMDPNTEESSLSRQHRSEHVITTRSGEQQHTSCAVGEHCDVHAFVNLEGKLRSFSSDLCRTIVERCSCFGQRDLMRAIAAVKRLDSDARQLPFSGGSWLQHPDFSRVLDCLVRALWRRRQRDTKPLGTHAPHIDDTGTDDILCAWHARGQQILGNVDESSEADNKQGERSIAMELKGALFVDTVAQGCGDSRDATRTREQRQNLQKYSLNFSAAKDDSPWSEALPSGMQSDPPIDASHSVERGRGRGTANCHVFLPAHYAADAGEDTSMLQLVCHVLRPCFAEHKVNKTDLSFPLSSPRERSSFLEKNDKRSISKPLSNRTFSEWNCSAPQHIEKRIQHTVRCTAQNQTTGVSAMRRSGERFDSEHKVKTPR